MCGGIVAWRFDGFFFNGIGKVDLFADCLDANVRECFEEVKNS